MLQNTNGKSCMSKTMVYALFKAFKNRQDLVVEFPLFSRPLMCTNDSKIDKIKNLVLENLVMNLREFAHNAVHIFLISL